MSVEKVEALVVGAGQAGVAMSEHLSRNGIPHLVLERDRIAERWRTGRWDSLVANGPAWHDRFPGMEFDGDPDAFVPKEAVADYFVAYAEKIAAPIRCGVEVKQRRAQLTAGPAFASRPRRARIEAEYVVAATGPFQRPVFPRIVPEDAGHHPDAFRRLPQPRPASGRGGARRRRRRLGRADRRGAARRRTARLHLRRPARPPAAPLPRPRQRLVARRPQQVGRGGRPDHRARHLRGQRRLRRRDRRLPPPRGAGHDAPRPGRVVRRRRDDLRAGARGQPRDRRRQLSLGARRGRRLGRAQRPRPPGGAGGPRHGARSRLRDRSDPVARPRGGGDHLDRLGHRLRARLRLAAGRRLRRAGQAEAPARRLGRARGLFPRAAVAVAPRLVLHLGRLARRASSWPTTSPSSAATWRTARRRARETEVA